MATWRLADIPQSGWSVTSKDAPNAPDGLRIERTRLTNGTSAGIDVLSVNNGGFSFTVLPTRGMGLGEATLASSQGGNEVRLGWQSPISHPVHPSFVPLHEPSGLGWLDGFNEMMCRCGLTSNGAPDFEENGALKYPLHGRVANLAAYDVEVQIEGDTITLLGTVDECRFHFQKLRMRTKITTRFNQAGLTIEDEVENLSASDGEMQMLYHCNFGSPLLGAGSELVVPAKRVVPRNDWAAEGIGHWSTYSAPTAAMPERVYFMDMHADNEGLTAALLHDATEQQGVTLKWNVRQLPCFTLWKNETALEDGYVTGIEPGTNFPNPRSFEGEKGRFVKLAPKQRHQMRLEFEVHGNKASVSAAQAQIAAIAGGRATDVSTTTDAAWCAP